MFRVAKDQRLLAMAQAVLYLCFLHSYYLFHLATITAMHMIASTFFASGYPGGQVGLVTVSYSRNVRNGLNSIRDIVWPQNLNDSPRFLGGISALGSLV